MEFRPGATLDTLQQRAHLFAQVRAFFKEREVLEVDVPVLGEAAVTDVHLEPLICTAGDQLLYLQTSPEFYMKRLLAAGSGSIYYLGKAFRAEECGRHHRREFTMLEWYRTNFDDRQLATEIVDLLQWLMPGVATDQTTYGGLFEQAFGTCPHTATAAELRDLARQHVDFQGELESTSDWLDLLFSHVIQPTLERPTVVFDYPSVQCALAKVTPDAAGKRVARRFELFWQRLELANGYWELTDATEQEQRFKADLELRTSLQRRVSPYDRKLLAALRHGLPPCSGVALGVDRLMMCLLQHPDIANVMTFADF